jgi:very-short-patch-repair endonuclease
LGWQVDTQIGAGAFKIDLGIVDPGAPARYLAGVECDGVTYHRSAIARDRDKLRQAALAGLGWKIFWFWGTDFWHYADNAIARLDASLRSLTSKAPRQKIPAPAPADFLSVSSTSFTAPTTDLKP